MAVVECIVALLSIVAGCLSINHCMATLLGHSVVDVLLCTELLICAMPLYDVSVWRGFGLMPWSARVVTFELNEVLQGMTPGRHTTNYGGDAVTGRLKRLLCS